MTKLILIRHCQAEGNLQRFFQGKIDSDITPKGRAQTAAAAEILSAEPIDIFYTSSLLRARKSTEGINVYHEVPVKIDDRLAEIDAGKWEGKFLTDIEKEFPEAYDKWKNDPANFAAPGGETMAQVYDRVSAALRDIIAENDGKTVCIVSHGCAIVNMMCYLHGWPLSAIGKIPLGTNMSINVVRAENGKPAQIIMENYTDHLDLIK
ncbi:MAG: histidine phosphatase family protein [Clostridia bacterium]|nr:histidine phosphatase family protein [Clostridia bacterium]